MATPHFLREDIKEVFNIFDEDASGTISIQEVSKALYTITGERVARSEVLKLIAHGRDAVAREQQKALETQRLAHHSVTSVPDAAGAAAAASQDPLASSTASAAAAAVVVGHGEGRPVSRSGELLSYSHNTRLSSAGGASVSGSMLHTSTTRAGGAQRTPQSHTHQLDSSEGIDVDVFEQVVLRKLQHRSYEEELAYTFALLEDSTYAGFITKDSLRRAAAETGEPLTEAEIAEMFDSLVTGAPTAAVDLSTFTDLQIAARKAEDS